MKKIVVKILTPCNTKLLKEVIECVERDSDGSMPYVDMDYEDKENAPDDFYICVTGISED